MTVCISSAFLPRIGAAIVTVLSVKSHRNTSHRCAGLSKSKALSGISPPKVSLTSHQVRTNSKTGSWENCGDTYIAGIPLIAMLLQWMSYQWWRLHVYWTMLAAMTEQWVNQQHQQPTIVPHRPYRAIGTESLMTMMMNHHQCQNLNITYTLYCTTSSTPCH